MRRTLPRESNGWRRIVSLLGGAGVTALSLVAATTLQPSTASASAGIVSVTLDGQPVVLPNQGDASKVDVVENLAVDCEPGTIVVGDKLNGNGRSLGADAGAGRVVLAVSIKSGSKNVTTAVFSGSTVTVTTTQDISNAVVVTCRPKQPAQPPVDDGGGGQETGGGSSTPTVTPPPASTPPPATAVPVGVQTPSVPTTVAQPPSRPAAPPAKPIRPRPACPTIRLTPRGAYVGKRLVVRLRVTRAGRALARARVTLTGAGTKKTVRTRRDGRATVVLRPRRTGFVRVRVVGAACSVKRIGIFGVLQPPSLTG